MKLLNKLILLFVFGFITFYNFFNIDLNIPFEWRFYSGLIFLFLLWLFLRRHKKKRPSLKPSLRMEVLHRDSYRCRKCGRTPPEVKLEVDHKVPWSWNKTEKMSEDTDDYITLCRECNIGKGNKFAD